MSLRDEETHARSFWNWDFLDGCFGRRGHPVDIDGVVERGGHFLFIETKPVGGEMSEGQHWLYRKLSWLPRCTVLILQGERNQPTAYFVMRRGSIIESNPLCGIDEVRAYCNRWYKLADEHGVFKVEQWG